MLVFDDTSLSVLLYMLRRFGHTHTPCSVIDSDYALLQQLQQSSSKLNLFLLSTVLKACGRLHAIFIGRQVHSIILKRGLCGDAVLMTSLLGMYSNCSFVEEARRVYDEMPVKDVISSNAMITGLCHCGLTAQALELFWQMKQRDLGSWNSLTSGLARCSDAAESLLFFKRMMQEGVKADLTTMVSVVSVCAHLVAEINGKQIHGLLVKQGLEKHVPVGNALLDMYAKCGCICDARLCFDNMPLKNVITWTSLIMGYGRHGLGLEALKVFEHMKVNGFIPNKLTFLGVLFACTHAGLVQEGWNIFDAMIHTYLIIPTMEHYTCMVDLLSRAGCLDEALKFIESMPIEPDPKLWTALLSSCVLYKNSSLTRYVGEKVLQLKPQSGAYMLLSNFYSRAGDWEGVAKVRRLMLERGMRKENGRSWIEINKTVHVFESGDKSHPQHKLIYNYLEGLVVRIRAGGYIPITSLVVQNVDDYTKEELILGHSEKLALGYGLISTQPGTKLVIMKNLRMCIDCHEAFKFISQIEGREIVARDSKRFHQFKAGICSCIDYW